MNSLQSILEPFGPDARAIYDIWNMMAWTMGTVFVVVMILALVAVFKKTKSDSAPFGDNRFILVGGVFLPTIILVALMVASLKGRLPILSTAHTTIEVTGHMWWWDVYYPESGIRTANEIHIPVGKPVLLKLKSADVIHSFWVPNLAGKMDVLPDHTTHLWLQADKAGLFRGQCAEFCGLQHARMGIEVTALSPAEFADWQAAHTSSSEEELLAAATLGRSVFFEASCNTCHTIKNTDANGKAGPDLSYLGNRRTLGAGTLRHTRENLKSWVLNPQHTKPGNYMPPTPLTADKMEPLLDYLETLK